VILADELHGDPLGLGYGTHLPTDPQRVVDLLTTPIRTMLKPITAARALTWAAAGPMAAITDASTTIGHPARASCLAFLRAVSAGVELDPGDPGVKAVFDGWLAGALIDQAAHGALITAATKPASRADELGISALTARDIIDAWEAR
jgi:hypothetical protein